MPRKRHVSRNCDVLVKYEVLMGHASQEACE